VGTGLFVYTSNRLEELATALATIVRAEPLAPLQDETVLVPTLGQGRWLRQELAATHGIVAGLQLPFPGTFLRQLAGDPAAAAAAFDLDVLRFRIWRLLEQASPDGPLAQPVGYCADDPDQQKRFQLGWAIARCFDDYQLYRPDLLTAWAAGDDPADLGPHAAWQAELWRLLLRDADLLPATPPPPARGRRRKQPTGPLLFAPTHPAAPVAEATAALRLRRLQLLLEDQDQVRRRLPPRLMVFGASTLPPALVALLGQVATHIAVHLFVPAPTALFTGDQRTVDPDSHPLLARLGTEAREFAAALAAVGEQSHATRHWQVDLGSLVPRGDAAAGPTLLRTVQQDLAELRVRGDDRGADAPRFPLAATDASLRVHVCHSPQRELEVVRDHILAGFADDPTLEPHDVLVLVPDVERYAPFAHAVFGPVHEHLPFHVADKDPAAELPLCRAVLGVLDLAQQRLEVHDVLHLLEQPAVQQRFQLFPGELPLLRARCERAGIRWGLDGASRELLFGVPPFEENAWLPGLERIWLGVATGPVDDLVLDLLPVADVTSGRDDALRRFSHFATTLFGQLRHLQQPQPPDQWADRLATLVTTLFEPTDADDQRAAALLHAACARLRRDTTTARCRSPLHRTVLRDWLQQTLRQQAGPRGFLTGAVTVAALQPLRAVPVRRLFVCGLDDGTFPRTDRAAPFDLLASHRRPGDRSDRLDDRQLFLDLLLAAREQLHLSYVGRSQQDNSACAPSIVIDELLDHLERSCVVAKGRVRDHIVVDHPLQPWSARYRVRGAHRDRRLFTFARAELEPLPKQDQEPAFCPAPVRPPDELLAAALPMDRLEEFWWHPNRFFVRHVVQARLSRRDEPEATTEAFAVDPLARWQLENDIVERALRGVPPPRDPAAYMLATGELPVGGLGTLAFHDLDEEAQEFLQTVRSYGPSTARRFALELAGVHLQGEIQGVTTDHLVYARVAKVKPKDRLRLFLRHAVASVLRHRGEPGWPARAVLVGREEVVAYRPLQAAAASECLALLLQLYRDGLHEPLPWFEQASFAYGKARRDRKDHAHATQRARAKFDEAAGEASSGGDGEDDDIALCWRGREPWLDPRFQAYAELLWRQVLECSEKT
jgi:exodeoxyribonuclease V gamma subunit